jgi:hypothetical protein
MTFLRNHRGTIAAMDFCIVHTVSFQLLYVWFVIDHGRRRLIHCNVTKHPRASCVIQELPATLPSEHTPRYLLLDRDPIFSAELGSISVYFAMALLNGTAALLGQRGPDLVKIQGQSEADGGFGLRQCVG